VLAVTRAVRNRLPDGVQVMVDYNQALSVVDALERGRALQLPQSSRQNDD